MIGIYKITNKENNLCYIGQSKNLEKRLHSHMCSYEDSEIDKAIRENPFNFTYEIIENCKEEELNDREIYWIEYYNSYYHGYNETKGGTWKYNPQKDSIRLLSDEDIILIRKCYLDHEHYKSGAQVQREFFPNLDKHLIAEVFNGQLRLDIMPEVYKHKFTYKVTQKRELGEKNPASILTEEDVIIIRSLYTQKVRKEIIKLFPNYSERAIVSVLSGQNWKFLPIYQKKNKRWIYPDNWNDKQIKDFMERKDKILNEYKKY